MTVEEMVQELQAAKADGVAFVSYGDGDLGVPIPIDDAIADISQMEDHQIGAGTWCACEQ